jgi:hypothetical protein
LTGKAELGLTKRRGTLPHQLVWSEGEKERNRGEGGRERSISSPPERLISSPQLGENWTNKLTQPKEFNFMLRERVKVMLNEDTPSTPHSSSHSLPASPTASHRSSTHNAHHSGKPNPLSASLPILPPDTPKSVSSTCELDGPVCSPLPSCCSSPLLTLLTRSKSQTQEAMKILNN